MVPAGPAPTPCWGRRARTVRWPRRGRGRARRRGAGSSCVTWPMHCSGAGRRGADRGRGCCMLRRRRIEGRGEEAFPCPPPPQHTRTWVLGATCSRHLAAAVVVVVTGGVGRWSHRRGLLLLPTANEGREGQPAAAAAAACDGRGRTRCCSQRCGGQAAPTAPHPCPSAKPQGCPLWRRHPAPRRRRREQEGTATATAGLCRRLRPALARCSCSRVLSLSPSRPRPRPAPKGALAAAPPCLPHARHLHLHPLSRRPRQRWRRSCCARRAWRWMRARAGPSVGAWAPTHGPRAAVAVVVVLPGTAWGG